MNLPLLLPDRCGTRRTSEKIQDQIHRLTLKDQLKTVMFFRKFPAPLSLCSSNSTSPFFPRCYICKNNFPAQSMEWLSTSAEHMNSHAMHFPCLKGSNDQGPGRVLACKVCVNNLTVQWETMDADRVPLEHRKYIIPSPTPNAVSPSGGGGGGGGVGGVPGQHRAPIALATPPTTPAGSSVASTSVYCFVCGLHSELSFARLLYANKEVGFWKHFFTPGRITQSLSYF